MARRIDVANLFLEVVKDVKWLEPQFTPVHCTNSYWTFVIKLTHRDIDWLTFRNKYQEFGGDGIYAPWKLTYQELFYADLENKEENPSCPVAEHLQKTLLQFKTNYWRWSDAEEQADILKKTINFFNL